MLGWIITIYIVLAVVSFIIFAKVVIDEVKCKNSVLIMPIFKVPVYKLIIGAVFWPITWISILINSFVS